MKPSIKLILLLILYSTFIHAQLYIQNGAVITTTGNSTITLQDIDLINNGTIDQQTGEGKFVFTGSANNIISGNSNPLFDILEIAKTGSAKISLQQNINIGSGVNFTSGLIDLNNNNIYLQAAALLNGENETSHITGISGGFIQIAYPLSAPSAANPGNLGAIITSLQNLGNTIIRRGHVSQTNGDLTGSSINRYFDILPANNTGLNASLRIQYLDAELNALTENSLTVWKSDNSTRWINMGYSARDAAANYVEQSGVQDFSRWTLSSISNPLPVNFSFFNVNCTNNGILITWKTAQEQNSLSFEVQKSNDGIHFNTIASLSAAGNSNTEKLYTYTDNNNSSDLTFYRIAETDADGQKKYTGINQLQCEVPANEIKYWPNPVKQELFVNVTTSSASALAIKLYDSKGALVWAQNNNLLKGSNQVIINMNRFAAGVYSMLLDWNNHQNHKVIQLQKQ